MVEMSGGLFGVTTTAQGLLSALADGAAHRDERAV
jgi:hypothetical protein